MLIPRENLPFDLDLIKVPAYLVGGAVRDALLGRKREYLDLDFVLPRKAVRTARKLADLYSGGFVLLDKKRRIARVVLPEGTLDFAKQDGETLEIDLSHRDFTINAIAYDFQSQEIFDPLGGQKDLAEGIMRMISRDNFKSDPLRMLRAYRQAGQLNFSIEAETRSAIGDLAPMISTVSAERIQTELNHLLSNPGGSNWLKDAWEDGLFSPWLPKVTEENLAKLTQVELLPELLSQTWPDLYAQLQEKVGTVSLSRFNLAKLATLVSLDPEIAGEELLNLKYSRAEMRTVINSVKFLPLLLSLATAPLSIRQQYVFFRDVLKAFPTLIALTLATAAVREDFEAQTWVELLKPIVNRYLDPEDQVAHPTPLIRGKDLIEALSLHPSRRMGKVLTEIQLARIEGKISTREEAIEFAANWEK